MLLWTCSVLVGKMRIKMTAQTKELPEMGMELFATWAEDCLITDTGVDVAWLAGDILKNQTDPSSGYHKKANELYEKAKEVRSDISEIFNGNEIHKIWLWDLAAVQCTETALDALQLEVLCRDNLLTGPAKLFAAAETIWTEIGERCRANIRHLRNLRDSGKNADKTPLPTKGWKAHAYARSDEKKGE